MWPEKRWEEGQRISEDRDSRVWNEAIDLCRAARDEEVGELVEALKDIATMPEYDQDDAIRLRAKAAFALTKHESKERRV